MGEAAYTSENLSSSFINPEAENKPMMLAAYLEDVELGSLCYMMNHRGNNGSYMLYTPDEDARQRIVFLHDCRNQLAHVICCTANQVAELLRSV